MTEPGLLLTRLLFVVMAAAAWAAWSRGRSRERLDTAVMLSALSVPIFTETLAQLGVDSPWLPSLGAIALMLHPLLMLRLVWHFQPRRPILDRLAAGGSAASVLVLLVLPVPLSAPLTIALTLWFVGLESLASGWLLLGSRHTRGVSRWRMRLAGTGSVLIAAIIGFTGMIAVYPSIEPLLHTSSVLLSVAAGLTYSMGFMPPQWLQRAWQDGELRVFLEHGRDCAVTERGDRMLAVLGPAAERCVGGLRSHVAVWDPERGGFEALSGEPWSPPAPLLTLWSRREAALLTHTLAIPIVGSEQPLGLLVIELPAGLLFPEEDIRLLQLLAEQAALAVEQQQLIEELSGTNRRLLGAISAKDAFLAGVSHELRTPLNSIIGFTELVIDDVAGPTTAQQQEYLGDVLGSAEHLLALINDVLDLSRIEAGQLRLVPRPVDLPALVGAACEAQRLLLAQRSLTLDVSVSPELPVVHLDPVRLRQILDNYLSNAIKFTPPGGRIQISVEPDRADWFRLLVTDTGVGIRPEDQGRLFQRFERLESVDRTRTPGTGLGLALARELAEAQDGQVGLDSSPGEGSTFWVRLPCAQQAS